MATFAHFIPLYSDNTGAAFHEAVVKKVPGGYAHTFTNPTTHAVHTRFFDTKEEFADWHYDQQTIVVPCGPRNYVVHQVDQ
jgi:hypothetical protein